MRSTAQSSRSPSRSAVATFRKMWFCQMIGVAPLRLGIGSFQAMLSPVSDDHFSGSPFASLTPFIRGPRQCGQFAAASEAPAKHTSAKDNVSGFIEFTVITIPDLLEIERHHLRAVAHIECRSDQRWNRPGFVRQCHRFGENVEALPGQLRQPKITLLLKNNQFAVCMQESQTHELAVLPD